MNNSGMSDKNYGNTLAADLAAAALRIERMCSRLSVAGADECRLIAKELPSELGLVRSLGARLRRILCAQPLTFARK